MEVQWTAVAIAIAATAVLIAFRLGQRPNGKANMWPPGPPKLPIIGNMHQIIKGRDPFHVAMTKLARVHGPLMTVWLGSSQPTIIVSDQDLAWEVLVSKSSDFADRVTPALPKLLSSRVINSSNAGAHWHALRRGLQTEAVGPLSLSLQTPLQESDMSRMIDDIAHEASRNGGLVRPFHHIRRSTIRLLARLCFGSNFSDINFDATMDDLVEDFINQGDATRLLDAFPSIRFFPSVRRSIAQIEKLRASVMELIGTHLPSRPPPNCYAHFLLSQGFGKEAAIFNIFEVFVLGLDSTGSTTLWALGLLVQHQVVQQKLCQEITSKNKEEGMRIVKVEEVGKLEYLQAVMKETMRLKPIAPVAVPHKAARETMLNGMFVAEGTTVMVNLYALHRDPKVWDEPDEFMPERWLQEVEEQTSKEKLQHSFLPFGAGMRACAGMDVGKLQFAFTLSNLVKAFHWSNAVEGEMPDLAEDFTFVLAMKNPLQARVVPRGI